MAVFKRRQHYPMSDTLLIQVQDSLGRTAQATFIIPIFAPSPAATPTFSPVAGTYSSTQNVTISCTTPSSTIYYTTDGSTPTTASTVFTSPIAVSVSETLKAIATASGFTQSAVGSAAYTISSGATFDFYISPTGVNTNVGSLASPWAITAINTKQSAYAGKRLGILPGTYDVSGLMYFGSASGHSTALMIN